LSRNDCLDEDAYTVEAEGRGGEVKGWRGMGMQQAAGALLSGCMIGREAVMCVYMCVYV